MISETGRFGLKMTSEPALQKGKSENWGTTFWSNYFSRRQNVGFFFLIRRFIICDNNKIVPNNKTEATNIFFSVESSADVKYQVNSDPVISHLGQFPSASFSFQ